MENKYYYKIGELGIESIENGWILKTHEPFTDDEEKLNEHLKAFVCDTDCDEEKAELNESIAVQSLLWDILEELRPYSKHRKYNVVVRIEEDGEIKEE